MHPAQSILPVDDEGTRLREFDLNEINCPDQCSHFALKYTGRLEAVLSAIRRLVPQGGRVLEVGCAQANASLLLAEEGYTTIALDTLHGAIRYARQKYETGNFIPVYGRAEDLPLKHASCDAIYLGEIIEHCADPVALLIEIKKYLKPGGVMLITTMNGEWLGSPDPTFTQVKSQDVANRQYGRGGEDHLFAFTAQQLRQVTLSANLQVVALERHATILHSDRLMPVKRLMSPLLLRRLSRFVCRLPWLGRKTALTLLLIARKT